MRTFEALSLGTANAEPPGRLTRPLQPAGFEALGGVKIKAGAHAVSTPPAATSKPLSKKQQAAHRKAEAERRKEEAARKKREAEIKKAEGALERARRRVAEAELKLRSTRGRES